LCFIEKHQLSAKGTGFVETHLFASALSAQIKLWTADKRLNSAATDFGINYQKK